MKLLFELILRLVSAKFYGELIIKFQNGVVKHVEKHESLDITPFQ
jgi:hypothetical protein